MQTSEPGAFPTGGVAGYNRVNSTGGMGEFYRGIKPLWMRQIPYTIVKFVAFEKIVA